MTSELLVANVRKHISLSSSEAELLISKFTFVHVARKAILLKQGESCHYIYFILSGGIRAYHSSQDGRESTIMFGIKDWWITDMNCFVNHLPALVSLEALEESTLLRISWNQMETLYQEIPQFERYFRILMQNAYIREQQRVLENITYPTEERYLRFIKKYPSISKRFTQKQIASYLGITPEFLSAVKRKSYKS